MTDDVDKLDFKEKCSICNSIKVYLIRVVITEHIVIFYCKECFDEYGGDEAHFKGSIIENE